MQFFIVTCLLVHYEAEKIDDFTLLSNVISKTHAEYLLSVSALSSCLSYFGLCLKVSIS